jgi:hypothetical protein
MSFWAGERVWVGVTAEGYEVSIRSDFFDDDRLDSACETLALRELSDVAGLWERIQAFFAVSPLSRPAHLLGGQWDLARLRFTNIDDEGVVYDEATCFVDCHLRGRLPQCVGGADGGWFTGITAWALACAGGVTLPTPPNQALQLTASPGDGAVL